MTNTKCCYESPRDFSALRQKIADKYKTECAFAAQIGMNKHQLSYRFRNLTPFKVGEILKICELLDIDTGEIGFYFRSPLVPKEEPIGIRKLIKQKYKSESAFAKQLGLSKHMLATRLQFEIDFRYAELVEMSKLLGLSMDELTDYIETERRIYNAKGAQETRSEDQAS